MFTIGNIIFFVILIVLAIITVITCAMLAYDRKEIIKYTIISSVICLVIIGMFVCGIALYNTQTESGKRALKDNKSNLQGGIYREILITAEDGREIFRYEGKVDIESNHEDNYIKFDDENGKRYIIYYGITDTIKIIEKEQ